MTKEQMTILNNLFFEARKSVNANKLEFNKNGIPYSNYIDKKIYSKIEKFLLQYGPTNLYRYRAGSEFDIDSIKKDTIWLSTLKEYNDPFESKFFIDVESIIDSYLYTDLSNMSLFNDYKDDFLYKKYANRIETIAKNLQEELSMKMLRIFATCFCEDKSSLLMWAHYANAHKGFCIGYRFEDIVKKFGVNILPVIYSKDYSVINSYEMLTNYDEFFLKIWRIKSVEWAYEKEWRLMGEYRLNEPYCKGIVTNMIKPSFIYMGVNIDSNVRTRLKVICKERNIELHQMYLSKKNYRLLSYSV